jgi:hypothetical protein
LIKKRGSTGNITVRPVKQALGSLAGVLSSEETDVYQDGYNKTGAPDFEVRRARSLASEVQGLKHSFECGRKGQRAHDKSNLCGLR